MNKILLNIGGTAPVTFLEVIRIAARQAGSLARLLQQEVSLRQKPGDTDESTALTAVDLAAQEVILLLLHAAMGELSVDAEEQTATLELFPDYDGHRPLVIIDPIDGTLNYIKGSDDYAVMAALHIKGLYRAAVVYFPVTDVMYWSTEKGSFYQGGKQDERPCAVKRRDRHLLISPYLDTEKRILLEAVGFTTEVSRCSAVEALAPISGRAAASINIRLDRRSAIGFPITVAAGGTVTIDKAIWQGEDPIKGYDPQSTVVVAGSTELAAELNELLVPS